METAIIRIGMERNAVGEPLVVVGGQSLGTVSWLREQLDTFEQSAKPNAAPVAMISGQPIYDPRTAA